MPPVRAFRHAIHQSCKLCFRTHVRPSARTVALARALYVLALDHGMTGEIFMISSL